MEQVMELSERLLPTLDNNDKETLRQTLKNTNKKLADVMAASQRRQQSLEKHAEDWQDYKVSYNILPPPSERNQALPQSPKIQGMVELSLVKVRKMIFG